MLRFILQRKLAAAVLITMTVLATVATTTAFACFIPPTNKTPHLVIIKTADHSSPVNAGDQIGFTVEVENTGDAAATGVSLNDTLPTGAGSGVTWAIASDPHSAFELGTSGGHQNLELKSSTLSTGADYTVHITAKTSPTECSVYNNSATLTASNASSAGPATAKETCQKPSLSVTKTADQSPVNAGDAIGFTIKVANAGPGTATSVGLSDPLPSGTASNWVIASQTNSGQCSISSGTLSCSGVSLAAGTSFSVHITSTTNLADCSTYPNTATASSSNAGSPTASATIVCQKPSPSVVTTQDPASGGIDDTFKDSATLSGAVNLDGSGSITFSLYAGKDCSGSVLDSETVQNVSADGAYATPNGFQIEKAGTYYWVASFGGDSNNQSTTSGCNDEPVSVLPNGAGITTTLSESAGNAGASVHDSATLAGVTADAGGTITYTVYTDSACTNKFADGGTVDVTNGSTPNSNDVTFSTPGTYYWQASYSGDADNTSALSKCTDEQLVIAPLIDLAVTKVGSPNPITLGSGNITWTMVVTNNGPSTATGVTISDPMPAGNTFVSATATEGSCTGGVILGCNLGTMGPGASVVITLVTTPSVVGTVINTVTVVGNDAETNYANNTASASVLVIAKPFTPPPPPTVFCVAVSKVTPNQLFVGRKTTLTIHLTKHGKAVEGVRVRIKGPKLNMRTKPSNAKGVVSQKVRPSKAGIVVFTPLASPHCGTKRLGVTGVFTPPVTG